MVTNINLIEWYVGGNNVPPRSPCPQHSKPMKPMKRSKPIYIKPPPHSEHPALHSDPPSPELVAQCRTWETQVLRGSIDFKHTTSVLYSEVCLRRNYDKSSDLSQDKRGKCASCTRVFFSRVDMGCAFCSADCRVSFTQRQADQQAEQYANQIYD